MQEIFSINNELIKSYSKLKQKKFRIQEGLFLIEGAKCVEDAHAHKIAIEKVFVLKNKIEKFNFPNTICVDEKVMKKLADTESAPEILAIGKIPEYKFDTEKFNKITILENIKDGGNLGTIIRSTCAFSIDAIILTGDCIDIYNPKVVRSSVGNIFKIPIFKMDIPEIKEKLKNFKIYSTVVKNGKDLNDINFADKSAILFGSEADGLTKELKDAAQEHITLKMKGNVESLNLAVCASIVFYEMGKNNTNFISK